MINAKVLTLRALFAAVFVMSLVVVGESRSADSHGARAQRVTGEAGSSKAQVAFDVGLNLAAILGASIRGTESEIASIYGGVNQMAGKLGVDFPHPPLGEKSGKRGAEGLVYCTRAWRDVRATLERLHGAKVAAAFSYAYSVAAANVLTLSVSNREWLLKKAARDGQLLGIRSSYS